MSISAEMFDWSITERKISLFIPNYSRKYLILQSMEYFHTALEKKDYIVVVGNDGIDESFDELAGRNVVSFTLYREGASPRNGGFIRNYFIKRCRSEYISQLDPEILVDADLLTATVNCRDIIRCGRVKNLTKDEYDDFLSKSVDIKELLRSSVQVSRHSSWVHCGLGMKSSILQEMRGYDERFLYYGCEDSNLYYRLIGRGYAFNLRQDLRAVHLWHPVNRIGSSYNRRVFNKIGASKFIANSRGWGEG